MGNYQLGKDIQDIQHRLAAIERCGSPSDVFDDRELIIGPLEAYADLKNIEVDAGGTIRKTFQAYAPVGRWGDWKTIDSHGGSISYRVTIWPANEAKVKGQVKFWSEGGVLTTLEFKKSIEFTTEDAWANVDARFYGISGPTALTGTIV